MSEEKVLHDKLEDVRTVLKRIRRGDAPTKEELAAAPQLECWSFSKHHGCLALSGYVTGHPTLQDGAYIYTSCLLWLSIDRGAARTVSRFYRLSTSVEELLAQKQ
ncbi:hypothetical protein HBA54_17290 [Pelagibius litoralis]|uniref:Uncharacterized protein n=1 Tax=Pelagibius litoralis TaxID=374515 RepID=A0A967K8C0_9PROT|nr:DUF6634 family protein [Pelagibius litoralis]NIA70363.1 hypothetical protein [Pelagibius litoralis]